MKKIILLFTVSFIFYSCLNNDDKPIEYSYELLPIDEFTSPASFTFGQKDTITLKYTLKNRCYNFDGIYYEYQDTTRYVAAKAIVYLDQVCAQEISQNEFSLIVTATQEEDYVFKFYKGIDSNGENIFEELIVPVN